MSKLVAIITGAGRGIGRAVAVELARLGYDLSLVARTEKDLKETANATGGALIISADVTKQEDAQRIVNKTLEQFGRIDALVNNAGYAPLRTIEQMTAQEWRDVLDTNLSAVFYLCQAVWPTFKNQNSGAIVNISSEASRDPFGGFFAYGAAKAGVNLMSRALAREGDASNIRVHTVAPSAVETAMFRGILSKEKYPTEKTLDPANVARVVGQCVAGDLRFTSGEVIYLHKTM